MTRDITNGKILTKSGYITSPEEVAEHLRARLATDEWKEKHKHKHINEIVVFYSDHKDIKRPRADHKARPVPSPHHTRCCTRTLAAPRAASRALYLAV